MAVSQEMAHETHESREEMGVQENRAPVEQKNGTHIRQRFEYERLDQFETEVKPDLFTTNSKVRGF